MYNEWVGWFDEFHTSQTAAFKRTLSNVYTPTPVVIPLVTYYTPSEMTAEISRLTAPAMWTGFNANAVAIKTLKYRKAVDNTLNFKNTIKHMMEHTFSRVSTLKVTKRMIVEYFISTYLSSCNYNGKSYESIITDLSTKYDHQQFLTLGYMVRAAIQFFTTLDMKAGSGYVENLNAVRQSFSDSFFKPYYVNMFLDASPDVLFDTSVYKDYIYGQKHIPIPSNKISSTTESAILDRYRASGNDESLDDYAVELLSITVAGTNNTYKTQFNLFIRNNDCVDDNTALRHFNICHDMYISAKQKLSGLQTSSSAPRTGSFKRKAPLHPIARSIRPKAPEDETTSMAVIP